MSKLYSLLIGLCTALLLGGCTEDTFDYLNTKEGELVELSLPYHALSRIPVNLGRADGEANPNELKELQVFIFDSNKRLKGYKFLPQAELKQNGERGTFTVKTRTGESYIYAVANVNPDYTLPYTIESKSGKTIPTSSAEAWNESDVQTFGRDFTVDDLKDLVFRREGDNINISDFIMSGSANGGQACMIAERADGLGYITSPTAADDQLIKLRRITSRVDFTIRDGRQGNVTYHFVPSNYEIYNISNTGSILVDGNAKANDGTFTNFVNGLFTPNTPNYFSVYLPENVQAAEVKDAAGLRALGTATGKQQRESYDRTVLSDPKQYTYAPENGTYIVLKGRYEEQNEDGDIKRVAKTSYTIHLGDFNRDVADFNVDRNCYYKYTITIAGVNEIVAEVETDTDNQPGAEGIVFDYDRGVNFTLDAHYEQRNMTFYKRDLDELLEMGKGYFYQVEDLGKKSDIVYVDRDGSLKKIDGTTGSLNGVDDSWIEFATSKGTNKPYADNPDRNPDGTVKTFSVSEFFRYLYDNQNTANFWDGRSPDQYVQFTCYVKENYHEGLSWQDFANKTARTFYIANEVKKSGDERSIHALAQYSVSQYAIQTFYNMQRAATLDAFGHETFREEEGMTGLSGTGQATGTDRWNGRANTIAQNGRSTWAQVNNNRRDLRYACMARNRDLNGNGVIDDNEVRWYCPAIDQYGGLWIGEAVINGIARLYQKSTADLYESGGKRINQEHYYTSTRGNRVFWAEEGYANGDNTDNGYAATYVRCIRTLEHGGGLGLKEADHYYTPLTIDGQENAGYDLGNISRYALRNADEILFDELPLHAERVTAGGTSTDWNRPAAKLQWSQQAMTKFNGADFQLADVIEGRVDCSQYHETPGDKWRVPNQRELVLLYINRVYDNLSGARTSFSNPNLRYGWMMADVLNTNHVKIGDNLRMLNRANAGTTHAIIRCVRDVR